MAAIGEAVVRPDVRLLTLTGPGGTGKTRLALAVAHELVGDGTDPHAGEERALTPFPDGVWFVSLATVRDPTLVLATIAQALGVRERDGRTLAETLPDALHDRRLLLVLDNAEVIAEACALGYHWSLNQGASIAARAGAAEHAAQLLGAAEALAVIHHLRIWPEGEADYIQTLGTARAALDEPAFAAAWEKGRALPLDAALTLAAQPILAAESSSS